VGNGSFQPSGEPMEPKITPFPVGSLSYPVAAGPEISTSALISGQPCALRTTKCPSPSVPTASILAHTNIIPLYQMKIVVVGWDLGMYPWMCVVRLVVIVRRWEEFLRASVPIHTQKRDREEDFSQVLCLLGIIRVLLVPESLYL